jgi:hypothetical protein
MVTLSDQQIAQEIRAALFIPLVLKHPRLADFVVSPRLRFRKAKSYDVASSIALIHFLQTKGFLDLLVIYHTFCHRAENSLLGGVAWAGSLHPPMGLFRSGECAE